MLLYDVPFERLFSKRNRVLLREMVKTDFKLRYQGSILGMAWSVMKPLMLFVVMYTVFVRFLRFGAGVPHFPVALLLAIVLWQFFAESASQGMQAVVARASLLRKISFPKSIIVISATVSALINLGISLVVVLVLALINHVAFQWHAVLFIPVLIQLYVLSLGLAFFLASLYVKWRDIGHIWDVVAQALFYATPIIYPLSLVAATSETGAKLLLLNPMAQMIQDARYLLIYDGTDTIWTYIDNPVVHFVPIVLTLLLAVLASVLFNKKSGEFAEEA